MAVLYSTAGDDSFVVPEEWKKKTEEAFLIILKKFSVGENAEVSVVFADGKTIRNLNRDFRGVDSETDVLSFPQYDKASEIPAGEKEILLGDIVLCTAKIYSQAEEYGHSPLREAVYLFVHGMLHLLGFDHMDEKEKKEMREAEDAFMEQIDLPR